MNLAAIHDARGDSEKSEPLLTRALAIMEKANGPKDRNAVAIREKLSELYTAQGHPEKADALNRLR